MAFGLRAMFGGDGPGRGGVRRGEIRPLILGVLVDKPMHGYEVIQALETQSGGRWRPSAGSVYPTLQQLADEGLVTGEEVDGRRTYELTEQGRAAAATKPGRPWSDDATGREPDIRQAAMEFMAAVMQAQRAGSPAVQRRGVEILSNARREIYRLLADDDAPSGPSVQDDTAHDDTNDAAPDRQA